MLKIFALVTFLFAAPAFANERSSTIEGYLAHQEEMFMRSFMRLLQFFHALPPSPPSQQASAGSNVNNGSSNNSSNPAGGGLAAVDIANGPSGSSPSLPLPGAALPLVAAVALMAGKRYLRQK